MENEDDSSKCGRRVCISTSREIGATIVSFDRSIGVASARARTAGAEGEPVRKQANAASDTVALLVAAIVAMACGTELAEGSTEASETGACPIGAEACPCTDGGACDAGLQCYSGVCVDIGDMPASSGDASTDDGGDSTSGSPPETTTDVGSSEDDSSGSSDSTGPVMECGNGLVDGDETCDGPDLGGATCSSEGFALGELACASDCASFDTRGCWNPECGDQVAEGSEVCDGSDLAGATCSSEGFESGVVACAPDCSALDVLGCGTCGNGVIDGDELCDSTSVAAETCQTQGYDSGTLVCSDSCDVFDPTGCGICGNGTIDGAEACDGGDLALTTCVALGYDSGTLACSIDCASFEAAGCGTCGNGVVDGDEVCDGTALGGETCQTQGYDNGTLQCASACAGLDASGCGTCGDGQIDPGEECDGMNLGGATCESLGLTGGGTPSCSSSCTLHTYSCCGNDGDGMTLQERIDLASDDDVIDVGPTVENVVIDGKRLTLRGNCTGTPATWTCADTNMKAIRIQNGSDVTIDGFVFEHCDGSTLAAGNSGVISAVDSERVVVVNNVFRNNAGYRGSVFTTHGGAMPVDGEVVLENNIMHDNIADDGGVIYIFGDTNSRIENNLIYGNAAVDYCGAVWLRDQLQAKMVFRKNVLWGNTADRNPALEVWSGQGAIVNSSIIAGNSPSNVAGVFVNAFSMFGGAPMFADPAAGDFSLLPGSPAIDTGDPALPDDPDGTVTDRGVALHLLPTEP